MNKRIIGIIFLLVFIAIPGFLQACQETLPTFEVLSLDITPPKITTGEKATVEVEIRNSNAKLDTYNVPLMVNGVADDRKSITLTPGATELITFTLTRSQAGTYRISVGSKELNLVVEKLLPPDFRLSNLEINPSKVDSGEKVVITAKIANIGGTQGSYTAELKVDDCTVQTEEVTVVAGADSILSFGICADLPGTYTVTLGELTGIFVVAVPIQPIPPSNPSNTPPVTYPCKARG
ncbi:MAG: CARDB domain-containing protein [Dehalococcoidia bacterium]